MISLKLTLGCGRVMPLLSGVTYILCLAGSIMKQAVLQEMAESQSISGAEHLA